MKILCPTDFGEAARVAIRLACQLAEWTSGTLDVVNVVHDLASNPYALASDGSDANRAAREEAKAMLDGVAKSLATEGSPPVSTTVLEGEADQAVLAYARETGVDLVVMGSHSRTSVERALMGSVAARIVRRAPIPVLIVPAGAREWGRVPNGTRLSVVAAIDGRPGSADVVDVLRRLRANIACDVDVLRMYWAPEEFRRLGLKGARDLSVPDPDVVTDLDRSLRQLVGVLPGAGTTTLSVQSAWGDPASELLTAAHDRKCDLVVVGAESRHGLGRVLHPPIAERLARRAEETPVLFVPSAPHPQANEVPRVFTVLAATDLSAVGNRAVPFAYSLLGRGGVVELCYVHERPLPTPPYAYESKSGALDEARRTEIEETLRSLIPTDAERFGISTRVNVIDGGRAGEGIVQAAERLHVDAITLGSHGRAGVARAVVGSVAETVVRHARRPVLVVPGPTN